MTDLEIQEQAEKILQEYKGDGVYIHEDDAIGAMNDLAKWMQEQDKWIDIAKYDFNKERNHVLRWHKIWKCIISVWYNKNDKDGLVWYTSDLSNRWSEQSFELFFMPLPSPPKTK